MSGNKDDRDLNIGLDQLALEIEPASLRQPDIKHETTGRVRQRGL